MEQAAHFIALYTERHLYAAPRSHIQALWMLDERSGAAHQDADKGIWVQPLGPLIDPLDVYVPGRRQQALVVATSAGPLALLVRRADDTLGYVAHTYQPLAPLLRERLARPWFSGTLIVEEQPILVLDLLSLVEIRRTLPLDDMYGTDISRHLSA
ncbi:MAG: hypothetical protein MUD01_03535 [Chloroflexaceae bacterium]|nr:hypothetical protein [Chloroflexaceae bacterium]